MKADNGVYVWDYISYLKDLQIITFYITIFFFIF